MKQLILVLGLFLLATNIFAEELVQITIALSPESAEYLTSKSATKEEQSKYIDNLLRKEMTLEQINAFQAEKAVDIQKAEDEFNAKIKTITWSDAYSVDVSNTIE